jgi:hypothetical protein
MYLRPDTYDQLNVPRPDTYDQLNVPGPDTYDQLNVPRPCYLCLQSTSTLRFCQPPGSQNPHRSPTKVHRGT